MGVTDGTQYFQTRWMDNVRNHGSIPMVTWEPWLWALGLDQPAFSLKSIIDGDWDAYITRWALDSKAWGHPYFLRFAHEMNGTWYPWSEQTNGNTAGQYVLAWQHVHDIFSAQGVTNVTWVWSPNVAYNGSTPLAGLYPGDAYVDWVGIDGYNWGTSKPGKHWQTFDEVFATTYRDLTSLAPGKRFLIAEVACAEEGGDKAGWIRDALETQVPTKYTRIEAVVWFNESKEADWRVGSSPSSLGAFRHAVRQPPYVTTFRP